ncbi:YceI family protein [Aestuariibaculum sediminum]|uniref:YceI family protein n=1 Tax=Aestuariibaculum sediminum TaxID=2770637 RepID=A0A8J6UGW7_9FLAO|nr:YceI family protein [Aestuariibaculum sediminum]MBD0832351.1 YceI family protein [Aestuariibaculum sediminum]
MKKIGYFLLLASFSLVACKNDKKESKPNIDTEKSVEVFVVKPEATSVKFTAYKTTDKVPVGGEFTVLKFNEKTGSSAEEALNNLKFSIPVSSLFTKDPSRDTKIKESFFGTMLDTELLSGTIKINNGEYVASLTMNGVTKDLPLNVEITDARRVLMTGTMNLNDWDALGALESLNKVCFDLHKGPDGVSKTWEEVAIEVSTYLRKG